MSDRDRDGGLSPHIDGPKSPSPCLPSSHYCGGMNGYGQKGPPVLLVNLGWE